jgi:hypothetical protein
MIKECLADVQGYSVTLFNRGKTALAKVPGETEATFQHRLSEAQFISGDRNNQEVYPQLLYAAVIFGLIVLPVLAAGSEQAERTPLRRHL